MRLEAGLTPVALAEKVGVSREVVANLEAGKVEPPSDLIEHIALVLGRVPLQGSPAIRKSLFLRKFARRERCDSSSAIRVQAKVHRG